MRNKNSNIQGRSSNVVKEISIPQGTALKGKFAPLGSKFFPLRAIPILKRGAIEENHCLIQ